MIDIETSLTKAIKRALIKHTPHIGVFGCAEVTIGWYGKERVDYITYDTNDIWRCYEIKITKSDFHSENHNTFVGHYNYYVLPQSLVDVVKEEIPNHIGIFAFVGDESGGYLDLCRRARKQSVVDSEMLKNSLIRCLYRDARALQDSNDEDVVRKYKRELTAKDKTIRELNNTIRECYREIQDLRRHPNQSPLETSDTLF